MKLVAFELSMPNRGSWNGKWSGSGKKYVRIKRFTKSDCIAFNIDDILKTGRFRYFWNDGWSAAIDVRVVTSTEAAKLRKESDGFCGYDWMIHSIIASGDILDR